MLHQTPPAGFQQRKTVYGPYSPSRLIAAKCPASFFAQYVRKDRVVGHTLASARGSAIHEVLANITQAKQAGVSLSQKQVSDWVTAAVNQFPAAYPQIDLVAAAADAYVGNPSPYILPTTSCETSFGIQLWEEVSFFDEANPQVAFVSVPYSLEDGNPNPDCFFGGKLDQISVDDVTRTITILDHKSTPSANENEDNNFQVSAYAWLVSMFYPGYTIKTVIHYAHPRLNFYAPPVVWDQEELREVGNYILMQIRALEGMPGPESFVAIPGNRCDYCHIVQECSLYGRVRDQKARGSLDLNVRSFADLQRLAEELHVVDAMSKEITKALKKGIETLCPDNGVSLQGIWYGFKSSEESVDWSATDIKIREESRRARFRLENMDFTEEEKPMLEQIANYETLDKMLKKFGVEAEHFKAFNGLKLKNIWRLDKPELLQELAKFVVKDKSTRFGAHKH